MHDNKRCKSNLKQLYVAITIYAAINNEHSPDINGSNDLSFLIDEGLLDEKSSLGNCPGERGRQTLRNASYIAGPALDGRLLSEITLDDFLLKCKGRFHKAGINTIFIDGSITQEERIV